VTDTAAPGGVPFRIVPVPLLGTRRARHLVERNILVYRRSWVFFVSGFFEPFFYLLSIGVGLSKLVHLIHAGGHVIPFATYVAPGLLASSAMNGATLDSTFNVFFKLKIAKTYDAVLSTPLGPGDVGPRGTDVVAHAGHGLLDGFSHRHGRVRLRAVAVGRPVPAAAMLISYAFAAVGMAATTYMRSWQDFDKVSLALIPLFLFLRQPSTPCRCIRAGSRPWSAAPPCTRVWCSCVASTSGSCRGRWRAMPPISPWRDASASSWPHGAWPPCCCPELLLL